MTRIQAQRRNFLKYRLKGIYLDTKTKVLTEDEIQNLELIKKLIEIILCKWDKNTLSFVEEDSSALKKYKCWCGQRTNIERIVTYKDNIQRDVCRKHYMEYLEEQLVIARREYKKPIE